MKVDRVKMVEKFLEDAKLRNEYDPNLERKLRQHRVSTSLQNLHSVNIWQCGEFESAVDEEDESLKKRASSFVNIMPVVKTSSDEMAPSEQAETTPYYKLSKKEKKQIKKDLLEFSKKLQGQNKESLQRLNLLIQTEEAQEAWICEGSEASSILDNHRRNKKKQGNLLR